MREDVQLYIRQGANGGLVDMLTSEGTLHCLQRDMLTSEGVDLLQEDMLISEGTLHCLQKDINFRK